MKKMSALGFFLLGTISVFAAESMDAIRPPHSEIIQRWLLAHPGYRLATTSDCNCDEDIEAIRKGDGNAWKPEPGYQPYVAIGDFDGDGVEDIATVAVPDRADAGIFVLIALSAPNGEAGEVLQVARDGSNVAGRGLFVRRANLKSNGICSRLLFGAFSSEAEDIPIKRPNHAIED